MTDLELRLEAFVKLGDLFREFCEYSKKAGENKRELHGWQLELEKVTTLANHKNGWFTKENVLFSMENWSESLTAEKLGSWLSPYHIRPDHKKVLLVMAGNIPLVGFHDFLATVLTGNTALVKLSSNDNVLMPFVIKYLAAVAPILSDRMVVTDGLIKDYDVVIATGSNNTARYFERYFGNRPNIIRKNRNSVAVLTGGENREQLHALGEDIFRYYGLGCRSVSKLFVPTGYNFDPFFGAILPYSDIMDLPKYANNYDYNKAVYLMSEFSFLDNGFLMLKEDKSYSSPIATMFYETYDSLDGLSDILQRDSDKLQCVVGNNAVGGEIDFGKTQHPSLKDYADGMDTVEFLLTTSSQY
ncbi:MAG: acyl-CoA reductase [Sediminicola sp.]